MSFSSPAMRKGEAVSANVPFVLFDNQALAHTGYPPHHLSFALKTAGSGISSRTLLVLENVHETQPSSKSSVNPNTSKASVFSSATADLIDSTLADPEQTASAPPRNSPEDGISSLERNIASSL